MKRKQGFVTLIRGREIKRRILLNTKNYNMQKTKEIHAQGFYIFESRATANSNYIENISEAKLLMRLAKLYLNDYINIKDYIINRHGWQMAVSLKKEVVIRNSYEKKLAKRSKLRNSISTEMEVWRIISEAVRLFISKYVQQVNFRRKREGTLVKTSYVRSFFPSLGEAKMHLKRMRNQLIVMYQRKRKYRGLKSHYQIRRNGEKGSVFLCSKELDPIKTKKSGGESTVFAYLRDLVLPNLIKSTLNAHFLNQPIQKTHNYLYQKQE